MLVCVLLCYCVYNTLVDLRRNTCDRNECVYNVYSNTTLLKVVCNNLNNINEKLLDIVNKQLAISCMLYENSCGVVWCLTLDNHKLEMSVGKGFH